MENLPGPKYLHPHPVEMYFLTLKENKSSDISVFPGVGRMAWIYPTERTGGVNSINASCCY